MNKYGLSDDLALVLLGKIVNGADTDNMLEFSPKVTFAIAELIWVSRTTTRSTPAAVDCLCDCQEMVRQAKPEGMFRDNY